MARGLPVPPTLFPGRWMGIGRSTGFLARSKPPRSPSSRDTRSLPSVLFHPRLVAAGSRPRRPVPRRRRRREPPATSTTAVASPLHSPCFPFLFSFAEKDRRTGMPLWLFHAPRLAVGCWAGEPPAVRTPLAPFTGDRDARYRGLETGAVHFAPEGDSFLSAVAKAPPVFFFPVPPLDAHGNRAKRARPVVAHFAGDPRPTGEISFPLCNFRVGVLWCCGEIEMDRVSFSFLPKRSNTRKCSDTIV
jgi:hypothetical protein